MKTYTFNIEKKNYNNSSNKSNNTSFINSIIRNNLKKALPDIFGIASARTINTRTIDISITKKTNKFDYRKYADFKHAVDHILSLYNDRADFYLPDGTPVRIFEDEIQVGYELIPFYKIEKDYSNISDTVKKAIIDIYITISK